MTAATNSTSKKFVDLVLIEPVTAFGGTERHTIGLIQELQRKGLRIAFIESGTPLVSPRIETNPNTLTVITTDLSMSPGTRQELRAWNQVLDQFKADRALIIKSWNATGSTKFYELLKSRFKKILTIEHTTMAARPKWSMHIHFNKRVRTGLWWYKNYYQLKKRANLVDHVITVSNFNKLCLAENALVPENKITVCPNGIDTSFWQKDIQKSLKFRQQLDIPIDAFVFGCVGRLSPEKGFDLAINAFKNFQKYDSARNSYLIIIGEGGMRGELETQAQGANGKILFTGFMSELVPAYSAMNAGLFTTHHNKFWSGESFGLSLIEAMSCECGVIAMNKGATTELIGNCSHISELLDTRDVDAWGFALNKYVSTPKDELEKRAAQLRKRVVENYDASLTYTRLVDTIMTV